MTRFDAATAETRRELFADAIAAHRERDSPFVTVEADRGTDDGHDHGPPWVQFADGVCNLDCTPAEYDRATSLLSEFPAFTVSERTEVEDTEGVNLRVEARADADRVAAFVDAVFLRVYDLPADYRAWVAAV